MRRRETGSSSTPSVRKLSSGEREKQNKNPESVAPSKNKIFPRRFATCVTVKRRGKKCRGFLASLPDFDAPCSVGIRREGRTKRRGKPSNLHEPSHFQPLPAALGRSRGEGEGSTYYMCARKESVLYR